MAGKLNSQIIIPMGRENKEERTALDCFEDMTIEYIEIGDTTILNYTEKLFNDCIEKWRDRRYKQVKCVKCGLN